MDVDGVYETSPLADPERRPWATASNPVIYAEDDSSEDGYVSASTTGSFSESAECEGSTSSFGPEAVSLDKVTDNSALPAEHIKDKVTDNIALPAEHIKDKVTDNSALPAEHTKDKVTDNTALPAEQTTTADKMDEKVDDVETTVNNGDTTAAEATPPAVPVILDNTQPVEDGTGADDASEDALPGLQPGTQGTQDDQQPSPVLLEEPQPLRMRTAVGFSYVDVRDAVVTKGENDEAVYNGCFAIRPSPLGGLGVFAVRAITRCEHVLVERPLVRTTLPRLERALARLPAARRAAYYRLHGFHPDAAASEAVRIWTANTFVAGTSHEAVFELASRFNHACGSSSRRNIDYKYDRAQGVLVMTAVRRIEAGDELFITYGKSPRMLFDRFGFRCRCGGCAGYPEEEEDVNPW